jgi:hypothetical protein
MSSSKLHLLNKNKLWRERWCRHDKEWRGGERERRDVQRSGKSNWNSSTDVSIKKGSKVFFPQVKFGTLLDFVEETVLILG